MKHICLKISIVIAVFVCTVLYPGKTIADSGVSIGISHGDENSQAYDIAFQKVLTPISSSEYFDIGPLVGAGISLWEHPDKALWGGNVNVGIMGVFSGGDAWRPFIAGTLGLAVLSSDEFNDLDLGCRVQFRSRGSLGVKFGEGLRHVLQCDVTHYSNGGMAGENDGYSTMGLSYGFTF